jgi:prepilin-type N-terminal cleavage/methylation domain-containing protein
MARTVTARSAAGRRRQAGVTLVELLVAMVIMTVITTMIIGGWIALQSSYARSVNQNDARSSARYALDFASAEIRGAQPQTVTTPPQSPITLATPMEIDYYSSHDQPGTAADGTGTGNLRLTRIYLNTTSGTLYWQRDTNGSGTWGSGDRTIVLATGVLNNSTANSNVTPGTAYTAVFTYGYLDSNGNYTSADTVTSANLAAIVSVTVHVLVGTQSSHKIAPADLQITVAPRNAPNG